MPTPQLTSTYSIKAYIATTLWYVLNKFTILKKIPNIISKIKFMSQFVNCISGTDVMIFKYFRRKFGENIGVFISNYI
jgi:hypothetical protein